MELFFTKRNNVIFGLIVIILMIYNLINIINNTPMVPDQFWAQKIFYFHVPIAWTGFLSYLVVMIAGILFLSTKRIIWDHLGLAAAEIGTLFILLVLITGPIWAKPIWGTWWTWEPRLTTTLILFLIYIGYFMLRNFGGQKASWQIELKGATAAHGRCGGGNVASIVNEYAPNAMPWDNTNFYNSCSLTNRNARMSITTEICELLVEFNAKNIIRGLEQQRDLAQYEVIVARKPQEWRYSKLNGLRLLKALRNNPTKADQIVQALYLFASSQLDFSSVFVKVY